MRIQKYIADCGICSRRKAEELILAGRVSIDKNIAKLGDNYQENSNIFIDGKLIKNNIDSIVIMINKPIGIICSAKDQFGRKIILDLLPKKLRDKRLYPIGRLDYNTQGLILLTNDGDIAYKLTHPSNNIKKTYIVKTNKKITQKEIDAFKNGILIDGYKTKPAKLQISNDKSIVILNEGRNRQIRKMFEKLGHKVIELKRISIGNLELGNLEAGKYKILNKENIKLVINNKYIS
jgi:23S rRNA pseudouridine2605 synthase